MPGDDAVRDPYVTTTRAVTINVAPKDVWPWLLQIGAGRAGLYSYDWLDRLFGFIHGPSADRIIPEFQQLSVGDLIPIGRGPSWPVTILEPERVLVLEPVPGRVTWSFGLYPADSATRLVSRVRMRLYSRPVVWLAAPAIDGAWLLMERKMLRGIKIRAESLARAQPRWRRRDEETVGEATRITGSV
jgi:hypothetical protein